MIVTPASTVKSSEVVAVTVVGGRRPGSASERPLTLNPSPPHILFLSPTGGEVR
jgi:hypothetical protein